MADTQQEYVLPEQPQSDLGSNTLFMGLYLVLLAFFLLLNSVAELDKVKEKKTIASLHQTFSAQTGIAPNDMQQIMSFEFLVAKAYGEIQALAKSMVPMNEISISQSGSVMRLVIPTSRIFRPNSIELRRQQREFFSQIAGILHENFEGVPMELNFSIDSATYLRADVQPNYSLDMKRAALVAQELVSNGISKWSVVGGIVPSPDDHIILDFKVTYNQQ